MDKEDSYISVISDNFSVTLGEKAEHRVEPGRVPTRDKEDGREC